MYILIYIQSRNWVLSWCHDARPMSWDVAAAIFGFANFLSQPNVTAIDAKWISLSASQFQFKTFFMDNQLHNRKTQWDGVHFNYLKITFSQSVIFSQIFKPCQWLKMSRNLKKFVDILNILNSAFFLQSQLTHPALASAYMRPVLVIYLNWSKRCLIAYFPTNKLNARLFNCWHIYI